MSYPKPLVEMFADVVTATSNKILATLQDAQDSIRTINYMYGHPLEVMSTLAAMEKGTDSRFEKFPAIILMQDFTENFQNVGSNYVQAQNLNIVICMATRAEYTSAERYTNTFKPILYPLYAEFVKQIAMYDGFSVKFRHPKNVEHNKTDRMYWGKNGLYSNTGNIFSDRIDAIEIQNLNLTIRKTHC